MRMTLPSEALSLILIVAMFAIAAAVWPTAPDRIPVHWGPDGQPDRYGGKVEGLFSIPLMAAGMYLLLIILPRVDPRREHYARFAGAYGIIRTTIVALLAAVYLLIVLWARGRPLDVSLAVPVLVGMLFMVLGNYMPKFRSNWFVGIRTPWTLSSEETWAKTHRLGGRVFVVMGTLLVAVGITRPAWGPWMVMAMTGAATALLWGYSYVIWKRDSAIRADDDPLSGHGARA